DARRAPRREPRLSGEVRPHLHRLRDRQIGRRDARDREGAHGERSRYRDEARRRRATQDHRAPAREAGAAMKSISTHVLDIARGRPAEGVPIRLEKQDGSAWKEIGAGKTNADGRLPGLLPDGALE